ncbi:PTS transporter subunit EIIC [Shigella flexneri]
MLSFIWPPIGLAIEIFSQWAAYQNPVVAFGIYGFIERCLVPFGLHHIWTYLSRCRLVNTPTQQVRFSTATFRVIWRVTRLRVTVGRLPVQMYGLPAAAIAIWVLR